MAAPGSPGPIARIGHENLAQPTQHVLALTALEVLMKDPSPLLAKAAHAKWLDGYRFVIAEVQRDYGVNGLSVTAAP